MRARRAKQDNTNLTADQIRRRVFARAIKLLAAKPRSISELRERLRLGRFRNCEAEVESAIERLKEYGYLDDERFAFGYASLRVQQRPLGRNRLTRDLQLKKVKREVAEEALDQVFRETPEELLIDRAIEKRMRLRGRPKNRLEAKSLFNHLIRLGFGFELVAEKVSGIIRAGDTTEID